MSTKHAKPRDNLLGLALALGTGCSASAGGGADDLSPLLSEGSPLRQLSLGIVGGQPSTDDQNSVVLLSRDNFFGWCTGAVVAPNLVLTARHCLYEVLLGENRAFFCEGAGSGAPVVDVYEAATFDVFVGKARPLQDSPARGVRIFSNPTLDLCASDLGLLQIEPPLELEPLPLRLDEPVSIGEVGNLIGWGSTELDLVNNGGNRISDARHQREVRVLAVGPARYSPVGGAERDLEEALFLASEGGCFGDSGAPLVSTRTGAIIGVQQGVQGLDPSLGLRDEDRPDQCLAGVTALQRLELEAGWVRDAFRDANAAPWLEGKRRPAASGEACDEAAECISGLCATAGDSRFCSVGCGDAAACPDDMQCAGDPSDPVCVPMSLTGRSPADASCATTHAPARPPLTLTAPLATLALWQLRRRRAALHLQTRIGRPS